MTDLKEKMQKISELKNRILDDAKIECCESGDIEKAGLMVDMVKDLASAEKDCAEACYYKQIVEAMEEAKQEEMMGRMSMMGYNNNRYASGRYAPAGHGDMTRGYHPSMNEFGLDRMPKDMMEQAYLNEYLDERMGYSDGNRSYSGETRGSNSRRDGYSGERDIDEHLEMLRMEYRNANTDQKKREVKEKIERMLNDMR